MTYYLIVWLEAQEQWHEVDTTVVPYRHHDPLRYAFAVLRNTHPRVCGRDNFWAVVADRDLAEALERNPTIAA